MVASLWFCWNLSTWIYLCISTLTEWAPAKTDSSARYSSSWSRKYFLPNCSSKSYNESGLKHAAPNLTHRIVFDVFPWKWLVPIIILPGFSLSNLQNLCTKSECNGESSSNAQMFSLGYALRVGKYFLYAFVFSLVQSISNQSQSSFNSTIFGGKSFSLFLNSSVDSTSMTLYLYVVFWVSIESKTNKKEGS